MKTSFEHYFSGETLYNKMVAPVCEKHGLTYMEFTVLLFLANNPEYDTASQIVACRHLTKSHVSISVRSLTERGLLTGFRGEKNRRAIHLQVTPAAESLIREGREAQQKFYNVIHSGFSPEEEKLMQNMIARIDENIDRYLKEELDG